MSVFKKVLVAICIGSALGASAVGYWWYAPRNVEPVETYKTAAEQDVYVRFSMEAYDTIEREYWRTTTVGEYGELYRLALVKVTGKSNEAVKLATTTREGIANMIAAEVRALSDEKKKQFTVDLITVVVTNLAPQGRNQLLSEKQEQQMRDTANNVNRNQNLYTTLAVEENASIEKVQEAFVAKKAELEASTTPEAKAALKEVERAHEVLTDTTTKAIYDQTKIEPSLESKVISKNTLYINMSKVTPATFTEFLTTLQNIKDRPEITGLILDMRGNVGGALDFARYLLALFVGPNQYAFDLFHQDEYKVERTPAVPKIDALDNVKHMAILVDGMTQSTAELTATIFKRLNRAVIVGAQTRGWGTVENTYPIATQLSSDEKYALFLVNGITLRTDNQPIESRGIDPDVRIDDPKWKIKLRELLNAPTFTSAVIEAVSSTGK